MPVVGVLTDLWPSTSEPHNGPFVRDLTVRMSQRFHEVVLVPKLVLPGLHRRVWGRDVQGWQHGLERPGAGVRVLRYPMLRIPKGTETSARVLGSRAVLRLHGERPDVLHGHFLYAVAPACVRLAEALNVPALLTAHGTDVRWLRDRGNDVRGRDHAEMVDACLRASGITCVAQWMVEHFVAIGVPEERIAVIPMGVDETVFRPRARSEVRAQLGLELAARVVLFIGRATPQKGSEVLREALSGLDSVRCYVAGQFGIEGCTHLGMLDPESLATWIAAADIVCLPSFSEGMPVSVSESLACGTPVVGTAVGGLLEQIREGENGLLVPPGDALALRDAMIAAFEREWEGCAIRASSERFWWRSVTQRFEELVDRLIAAPPSIR
ncbi:MAG TPA: glycosyltransferase [Gaiellaceae bacterium]|nr:glycosyltransferase [Gaiellaceae bacterium]